MGALGKILYGVCMVGCIIAIILLWSSNRDIGKRLENVRKGDLEEGSITLDKLSENIFKEIEITKADGTKISGVITDTKVENGVLVGKLVLTSEDDGLVTEFEIEDGSITEEKLSETLLEKINDASTTIINNTTTVTEENDFVLGEGDVMTVHLADGAVTEVKIEDGAITSTKILDGTITDSDISASADISWSKVSKVGSSIADFADRDFANLTNRTSDLLTISDSGGYYTATDVEGALQELGVTNAGLDGTYLRLDASNDPITSDLGINGDLGVGIAVPTDTVHLSGNSTTGLFIDTTSGTLDPYIELHGAGLVRGSEGFKITYDNDTGNTNLDTLFSGGGTNFRTGGRANPTLVVTGDDFVEINNTNEVPILRLKQNNVSKWALISNLSQANDFSIFDYSTSEHKFVIKDGSGNVGIGTIDPQTKLEIKDSTALTNTTSNTLTLSHSTSGTPAQNFGSGLMFKLESTTTENREAGLIEAYWNDESDATRRSKLNFSTYSGATKMTGLTIDDRGYVGVGTTGPGHLFHINKNQNGGTYLMVDNTTNGTASYAGLQLQTTGGSGLSIFASSPTYGAVGAWGNSGVIVTDLPLILSSYGASGTIKFQTGGISSGNVRMTIDEAGEVGIGTTGPTSRLHLLGSDTASTTTNLLVQNSSSADALRVYNDRYVYAGAFAEISDNTVYHDPAVALSVSSNSRTYLVNFYDGGTARMVVKRDGTVGIGTTSPQSALQVVGYIQYDLTSGAPAGTDCDAANERGRSKFDNGTGTLYLCADSGWVAK